ncbi:MAG: phosphate ABC transporter permease PstA [Thermoleophilia bacterium]
MSTAQPPVPVLPGTTGSELTAGKLPQRAVPAVYGVAALAAIGVALAGMNRALAIVLAAFVAGVFLVGWAWLVEGRRRAIDRLVTISVTSAFFAALAPLVSLVETVAVKGSARFDTEFFTSSMRNVVGEGGGAYHAILGTLIITGLATLMSVPIGVLTAIYLVEYGRGRLKTAITFFVDLMTGIPSIVAGLFAFAVFAIFFGPGIRMGIMGAVALSILMIPIVVRSTEEMLKIVPNSLREASYALGVAKWRTILKVVLPTALAGMITGIVVAIARVIGETAPLLVTVGAITSVNGDPFNGRMSNLPVFSYDSYRSPGVPPEPYLHRAWAAALALIIIVLALNLVARLVYRRYGTHLR